MKTKKDSFDNIKYKEAKTSLLKIIDSVFFAERF